VKFLPLCLSTVALALATLVLLPARSEAFSTLGSFLVLGARDFRVFNNFSDASANNNTTPDPNFPGYTGAELAIWKACVEWASRPHGDGSGDPHQTTLGSGGANFDPSFIGRAPSVGSLANIHSELSGCSGGTLAFAETGSSWRIRYYSCWNWADGPGSSVSGIDLQGVAAHEYGHALGLGHTNASGATMRPSISGSGVNQRSISSDDINGVRFIYGVAASDKVRVDDVQVTAGIVTITGEHFSPTGNSAWFTSAGINDTGLPVKAVSIDSLNGGTQLVFPLPVGAGPGDVLVQRSGLDGADLSNPFPIDLDCAGPNRYCVAAPNSVFAGGATIAVQGSAVVGQGEFLLEVPALLPFNQFGLFIYGQGQVQQPAGDGFLCVSPFFRLPIQPVDIFGSVRRVLDFSQLPAAGQILPGSTWNFQFWYRDPQAGGSGFNFTDAIEVTFCE